MATLQLFEQMFMLVTRTQLGHSQLMDVIVDLTTDSPSLPSLWMPLVLKLGLPSCWQLVILATRPAPALARHHGWLAAQGLAQSPSVPRLCQLTALTWHPGKLGSTQSSVRLPPTTVCTHRIRRSLGTGCRESQWVEKLCCAPPRKVFGVATIESIRQREGVRGTIGTVALGSELSCDRHLIIIASFPWAINLISTATAAVLRVLSITIGADWTLQSASQPLPGLS